MFVEPGDPEFGIVEIGRAIQASIFVSHQFGNPRSSLKDSRKDTQSVISIVSKRTVFKPKEPGP